MDHFTVPPSFASTHFCRRLLVAGLHAFLIKKQCEDSNCCPRLSLLIHLVFFTALTLLEFPFRPFCWSELVQVARRNPAILRTKVFPTSSNFRRSRRSNFARPLGMLAVWKSTLGGCRPSDKGAGGAFGPQFGLKINGGGGWGALTWIRHWSKLLFLTQSCCFSPVLGSVVSIVHYKVIYK